MRAGKTCRSAGIVCVVDALASHDRGAVTLPLMLLHRVLTSAVAIPTLAALFYFDARFGSEAPLFVGFIVVVALAGGLEIAEMLKRLTPKLQIIDVLLGCLLLTALPLYLVSSWAKEGIRLDPGNPGGWGFLQEPSSGADAVALLANLGPLAGVFALAMALVDAVRFERGSYDPGEVVPTFAAKLLGVGYVGCGLTAASLLRFAPEAGYQLLIVLLVVVKAADIGAYTVGRLVGGWHPLKRLSPGKTLSGFAGGLVVGTLAGLATLAALGGLPGDWLTSLLPLKLLLLAAAGIVGDLLESLLKRSTGVKDSSNRIPGFGGVLDMIDSPLFAGAAWVVCLAAVQAVLSLL